MLTYCHLQSKGFLLAVARNPLGRDVATSQER